jgi:hypothetical protein
MSEIPAPYGHDNRHPVQRLADFLNGYLSWELLEDIPTPEKFHKDYEDMTPDDQRDFTEFALNAVFAEATRDVAEFLGRNPTIVEINLIKRRVVNFFKRGGIEYERD